MKRKLAFVTTFMVMGVMAVGASPARAAGIDGTGGVGTCPTTGKISIKPALNNGPDAGPGLVKVQTKPTKGGVCTGGTGDGANVISGQSKGSETTTTSLCTGLLGTVHNTLTLTVKWKTAKGTPKLNPSTVTITTETGGVSGDGHGTFDVSGTVTAGSFNGDTVTAHVETDQSVSDVTALCGGKGVKKLTWGGKPGSDNVLGSGSTTIN